MIERPPSESLNTKYMNLIDSHCHLERFHEKGILDEILENAKRDGITQVITVGTQAQDWTLYRELTGRHRGTIHYTVGLHPSYVGEDWEEQISQLHNFFKDDPSPVALGEIGLDFFRLPKSTDEAAAVKKRQEAAFKHQLLLALELNCPLVVHTRDTFHECVKFIDEAGIDWRKVVFHCFTHGPAEMRILMERGGRGSFTGIITYKNAESVREAARMQGLDVAMIETDAPYLSPEPFRGRQNEPSYLLHTARIFAQLFEKSGPECARQTTLNTRRFFHLSD